MRIGRTIPPAASPIDIGDIVNGLRGALKGQKELERFARSLREHFQVNHCYLVSSGRAALTITLQALHNLNPDRCEVIIPAFCCYSVPAAIVRAGLKTRLCDVDPVTLDFNYDELKKILCEYRIGYGRSFDEENASIRHEKDGESGSRSSGCAPLLAIVPVHLFGLAADVDRIIDLINDPAVTVVEDAAQVLGLEWNGRQLGTIGDVGIFSLGRGKSITAVEGGIIVTNNDDIGQQVGLEIKKITEYTLFGVVKLILQALALLLFQRPSFFWFPKSLPFLRVGDTIYDPDFKLCHMTPFQAGLAGDWHTKSRRYLELREKSSAEWSELECLRIFSDDYSPNGRRSPFIRYPLLIHTRKVWQRLLKVADSGGLGIMLTYPDSINGIKELKNMFKGQDYPVARSLSGRLLTLPVHPLLSQKDKLKIKSFLMDVAETASCQFKTNTQSM